MNNDYWLKQLGNLVSEKIGLHFPENRLKDLRQAVQAFAREHDQEDTEFIQSLIKSSLTEQQVKTFSSHLTVGETYFFREMSSLEAFRDHVISGLIKHPSGQKPRLRIWSAGCSSGEEPYTLAMLIDQIPESKKWDIHIYGTDINLHALEKAKSGVYTKWSFRGMSDNLRDRYFEPVKQGRYAVKARFKDMVSFSYLNLATDDYSSILNTQEINVIFCRNVLIYFTPQMIQRVIQRMHRFLTEGGWLIVAPSETSILLSSEFSPVPFAGATLYKKVSQEPFRPTPSIWPETLQVFPTAFPVPPPKDNLRLYKDALTAYQSGRYDEAIAALQMISPENGSIHHQGENEGKVSALMARSLANQGNLDQAVKWCEKAITKDKVNPDYRFLLAIILMELGQVKSAAQALKRSLYLKPDFIAAYYMLGTLAVRENRYPDANQLFQQALSFLSDVPAETVLTELDGITTGRLRETIQTLMVEGVMK